MKQDILCKKCAEEKSKKYPFKDGICSPYDGEFCKLVFGEALRPFWCDLCAAEILEGERCAAFSIWTRRIEYHPWERDYIKVDTIPEFFSMEKGPARVDGQGDAGEKQAGPTTNWKAPPLLLLNPLNPRIFPGLPDAFTQEGPGEIVFIAFDHFYTRGGWQFMNLEHRFTYHPPKGDQVARYERIRDNALLFAQLIDDLVPESREKALAITKLEEVVMWANAGIARNE